MKALRYFLFFGFAFIFASFLGVLGEASMDFHTDICDEIVKPVFEAVTAAGGTLVLIMFAYGGAKYAYSADNPGAAKQGKTICVHAIIGGILLILWEAVRTVLTGADWSCIT
jgi:hypothetical protein